MAIVKDPELRAVEEALAWQELERQLEEAARKRDHEFRLAKIQIQTKERHKVWYALVRLPLTCTAAVAITILTLARRDIPNALSNLLAE